MKDNRMVWVRRRVQRVLRRSGIRLFPAWLRPAGESRQKCPGPVGIDLSIGLCLDRGRLPGQGRQHQVIDCRGDIEPDRQIGQLYVGFVFLDAPHLVDPPEIIDDLAESPLPEQRGLRCSIQFHVQVARETLNELLQIASADLIPVRQRGELCHVGQVSLVLQRVVVECRQALADFGGSRQYPGVNVGPQEHGAAAVVKVTEQKRPETLDLCAGDDTALAQELAVL